MATDDFGPRADKTMFGVYPYLPRQWEKVFGTAIKVVSTSPEATEAQRAAFEADFNKFFAEDRHHIVAAAIPLPHFTGCLCVLCEKARSDNPVYVISADGLVRRVSETEAAESNLDRIDMSRWIIGVDTAYPAETNASSEADLGHQLDEAIGFVPMSPKPGPEPRPPPPIPARALQYGVAEAPLLEWPE